MTARYDDAGASRSPAQPLRDPAPNPGSDLPIPVRSVALDARRPHGAPGEAEPGLALAARAAVERVRELANAVTFESRDRAAPAGEAAGAAREVPANRPSDGAH